MLHTVTHVETSPPLYFVLIWAWAHVFGTSEVALRSVSTIAGVAIVPIAYLAGRELISRWAGVLAAAFATVNPFMIWYSQEARAYMLLATLCGASFLFFARALRDPSRRWLAWWAVCSSLALTTHFFAGFLVAPEALWLLWAARSRIALAAVAAVGAVQLAMLPLAIVDTTHGAGWVAKTSQLYRISKTVLEWGVSVLERRGGVFAGVAAGAVLVVVVALLVLLGGGRERRRGAAIAAAIAACVFVLPVVLGFVGQDYFFSRNEIPAFVPLTTVVAAACTAPRTRLLGGLLAAVLLAVFSFAAVYVQSHARFERPDWRAVAQSLGTTRLPRAILVAGGTSADPLKIYMPGVSWVQPQGRPTRIAEIDIVGATKRMRVIRSVPHTGRRGGSGAPVPMRVSNGRPLPRSTATRGSRLLGRFRVDNWVVARFALRHPERLNIHRLIAMAPRYFRLTPKSLLVFVQRPDRLTTTRRSS
jgi:hypothetical protein